MRLKELKYHAATNKTVTVCGSPIKRETGHLPWDDPEFFMKPTKELDQCRVCLRLLKEQGVKQ
jgi:hypothetical protein